MKLTNALYLVLICCSLNSFADNHIVYLGAGGEPAGDSTIFDDSAKLFTNFYQRNKENYKAVVAFNGDHKKTDGIIRKGFKNGEIKNRFSKESYEQIIQDLKAKMTSNPPQIKANEKIMIMIDTHGSEKSEGVNTHKISLAGAPIVGYNEGSDENNSVSLDTLKELADIAEEKGVNLAIIDGSCHSGNTLALSNSKTCVISGSAPNQFATGFTEELAKKMTKGKSLEQAFLDARQSADPTPFPMISSPIGKIVQGELESAIPFLFYHEEGDSVLDKIDNYLIEMADFEPYCKRERDYLGLKNFLNYMNGVLKQNQKKGKTNKFTSAALERLKKNIDKYKLVQDEYIKQYFTKGINQSELDAEIEFKVEDVSASFPLKDLLTNDFNKTIANTVADIAKATKAEDKIRLEKNLNLFIKFKNEQEARLKDPKYSTYVQLQNKLKTDERVQEKTVLAISKDLMGVYNEYYTSLKKELGTGSNPCSEFKI